MKYIFQIILFLTTLNNVVALNTFPPFKIGEMNMSENITGYTWYFEDTSRTYEIPEIQKKFKQLPFKQSTSPQTNFGQTKSYFWFVVPLLNQSNTTQSFVIQINNPKLTRIGLYKMDSLGVIHPIYFTGCSPYSFDQRPIHFRNFSFTLHLKKNEKATYLLFVDKAYQQLLVSIYLSSNNVFFEESTTNYLMIGIYSGVLLSIVFFNIFLYFSVRHRIHLYYAALIISTGMWVYADMGIGFQFLWPHSPSFNHIACSLLSMIALAFWILCIKFFLIKPAKDKNFINFLYVIVAYDLILAIGIVVAAIYHKAVAIFPNYLIAHSIAVFLSVIYIFVLLFRDLFRKNKPIYVLLPAFILMSTTTITKQLILSGYINGTEFLNRSILVGHITEFITLTILLSLYYQKLIKNNNLLKLELSEQQSKFFEDIVKTQEEERKRIAQNLHDELGGSLSAIKVNLSSLQQYDNYKTEKFSSIIHMVDNACTQLRSISHNLMPIVLVQLGFEKSIESLVEKLNQIQTIKFELFIDIGTQEIDKNSEISLYRMIKEITNNILKHSKANTAMIQIICEESNLLIIVEDDGVGFDTNATQTGIGISNIRSRVGALNGSLTIDSAIDKGTTTIVSIPL